MNMFIEVLARGRKRAASVTQQEKSQRSTNMRKFVNVEEVGHSHANARRSEVDEMRLAAVEALSFHPSRVPC